mgnify:FL=1
MIIIKSLINNALYVEDLDNCINNTISFGILRNSKILITGATGLIGSFLVDVLHRANETHNINIKIYALGRNKKRFYQRFPYFLGSDDVIFIEHDVIDTLDIGDSDIDYCIHAASNAYPAVMYNDPVGTIMANVQGTYNLLDCLTRHNGKRFVFISSGEVYGTVISTKEFHENVSGIVDLLNVRSCYPLSKRVAENLCVGYSTQYNLETVIVRPCHTYGPNNTQVDNRANVQFINNAAAKKNITLKSNGLQLRSYSYIADTCSGLLTVMINGNNKEAYNLSNSNSIITIRGFAEIVAQQAGVELHFASDDTQPSPFDNAVLNNDKLKGLGWNAIYDINTGIEHTLNVVRWLKC